MMGLKKKKWYFLITYEYNTNNHVNHINNTQLLGCLWDVKFGVVFG